jgi:hypothetical protein
MIWTTRSFRIAAEAEVCCGLNTQRSNLQKYLSGKIFFTFRYVLYCSCHKTAPRFPDTGDPALGKALRRLLIAEWAGTNAHPGKARQVRVRQKA